MNILAAGLHLLHLLLPALVLSALLAPATVRWRTGAGRRRGARWKSLLWGWLLLSILGCAVLLVGLWWHGRDGRLSTYAALVLVLGTAVATWRSR